jgi:uncharacterized membrane protein YgdD (TMEM256/DUF423 family)
MPSYRIWVVLGALNAACAVAMAAASSHAPALQAASSYLPSAVSMHQFHALGLVAVGLLLHGTAGNRWWQAAGALFLLGLMLFSFNLYARALWDFSALRALVPAGGSSFMLGWVLVAVGAWRQAVLPAA